VTIGKQVPLTLKLLACLKILGRGIVFEEVAEACLMGTETLRAFFHLFVVRFSKAFSSRFIRAPAIASEVQEASDLYARLGFPGCVGSIDCTHVRWVKCPSQTLHSHVGKEKFASRVFQVVVDATRRILVFTSSAPGSVSDKSVAHVDPFIRTLRTNSLFTEFQYHLRDEAGRPVEHRGAYLISDCGYHDWAVFAKPIKNSTDHRDIIYSKRLESVRKDVECCFGILKVCGSSGHCSRNVGILVRNCHG